MSLGVIPGLFAGKRLGVFGFCFLRVKFKLAKLPKYCTTRLSFTVFACLLVPSLR
ncbi:Na+/H+ antiporter NhaA [Campylobacter showae]|uniref:Na+/H+ antiporter NhaA n=1 Tax=Campylobacter showae TaxID=204 RepID=UPI0028D61118|nr:Na+/H+ antiporter NhaA [Campylobacter showae]